MKCIPAHSTGHITSRKNHIWTCTACTKRCDICDLGGQHKGTQTRGSSFLAPIGQGKKKNIGVFLGVEFLKGNPQLQSKKSPPPESSAPNLDCRWKGAESTGVLLILRLRRARELGGVRAMPSQVSGGRWRSLPLGGVFISACPDLVKCEGTPKKLGGACPKNVFCFLPLSFCAREPVLRRRASRSPAPAPAAGFGRPPLRPAPSPAQPPRPRCRRGPGGGGGCLRVVGAVGVVGV